MQRQPPHGGLPGQRRYPNQARPGAEPHALHGFTGDLPEAPNHSLPGVNYVGNAPAYLIVVKHTVPGVPSERYPCLVDLKLVTTVDHV
jgi:hypothetical protein